MVSYENMAYLKAVDGINRSDDFINLKPSVGYEFKENLFASVWYQLKNKTSNYEPAEYYDNKVGVNIKFCF